MKTATFSLFMQLLWLSALTGESVKYEGVDQLIPLSNRWVVVATSNVEDVVNELNTLTDGKYLERVNTWEDSQRIGKPNWGASKEATALREKWLVEARNRAGEKQLDDPAYFSISSSNDPDYKKPLHPLRTTRVLVSLGKSRIYGGPPIHYAHYSYLEMPMPLKEGKSYTIRLNNQKSVTFIYDEKRLVSRAVKVNQVGYLPQAKKFAYVGAYLHELGPMELNGSTRFEVIDAVSGGVVFSGVLKSRAMNPRFAPVPNKPHSGERPLMIGENLYEIDFSDVHKEGEYWIRVPGVGRSWSFKIGKDVYGEAFYTACRALYHQRSGMPIMKPYTEWQRLQYQSDPIYEADYIPFIGPFQAPKNYKIFEVVGATLDTSKSTLDGKGGWHDAADWDRNIYHYICILDLLNAYEIAPSKFTDGQLNIPESGNGIPDILDEAEYGLRVWLKSMNSKGGVAGFVETWSHPEIDDPNMKYAYSLRTRWGSLLFAGTAAQYAQLVAPFNAPLAKQYREAALKAYAFGANPENALGKVLIQAKTNRGKGTPYTLEWEEKEEGLKPFLLYAKLRLYLLTQDQVYLQGVEELADKKLKPYEYPFSNRDISVWLFFPIVYGPASKQLPQLFVNSWKQIYAASADELVGFSQSQPYRQSWPTYKDYWMSFGAGTMTNQARVLLQNFVLTGDKSFFQTALYNVDYTLGTNPMGMVWTTGLGEVFPIEPQHKISDRDAFDEPVPGLTLYGPTGAMYNDLKKWVWTTYDPNQGLTESFMSLANQKVPFFRTFASHPYLNTAQNEFTIHETISSTIFSFAMLMPEGWMPSDALKQRKPRTRKQLHGYWYLP